MPPETPTPPPPPPSPLAPAPAPPPPPRKIHWFRYGCGALLALMVIIVLTVVITIWWIQRPIKPVVLSPSEKAKVEQKINYLEQPAYPVTPPRQNLQTPPPQPPARAAAPENQPAPYEPGSKTIRLTQREMNGLLNENTDLGKSVRLEFDRDAVNAYVAVRIPQDFPIGGGKMFRARARFGLSVDSQGQPYAGLEDVSVLGISLPNAWLGGIKGQNLLGEAMGERRGGRRLKGIKTIHVEPGALVIELED